MAGYAAAKKAELKRAKGIILLPALYRFLWVPKSEDKANVEMDKPKLECNNIIRHP